MKIYEPLIVSRLGAKEKEGKHFSAQEKLGRDLYVYIRQAPSEP